MSLYRESLSYSWLSWKRMLPGLSDAIAALVLGVLILQVASVVLIFTLALNIALGSYCTLIMLHRDGLKSKETEFSTMLQGASIAAFLIIAVAVAALLNFKPAVGQQSFWFLILSIPRLFILCWNVYCGEILLRDGKLSIVQWITTSSIAIYIIGSWITIALFAYTGTTPVISILLIASYASILNTAIRAQRAVPRGERIHRNDTIAVLAGVCRWPKDIIGMGVALATAFTNVLELGFLALAGWVVVARFPEISVMYFPLVNMFEWASGFALGISRVYTERLIRKEAVSSYLESSVLYIAYGIVFVAVYLWVATQISAQLQVLSRGMLLFAFVYVLLDGLQLIHGSHLLAEPKGNRMTLIALLSYGPSLVILAAAFLFSLPIAFFSALLLPLALELFLLHLATTRSKLSQHA